MLKLYILSGSNHSEEAKKLLEETKLGLETVDVSERTLLAAIFQDLGIRELPTLVYKNTRYIGLKEIQDFRAKLEGNL